MTKPARLEPGTLHAWRADLDDGGDVDESSLTGEERARAARFAFERDGRRFRRARAVLRILLAEYLDASPGDIAFAAGPHGKPSLAGPAHRWLRFNASHAESIGVFAFGRDGEVGIDVECLSTRADPAVVAPSVFDADERRALGEAAGSLNAFLVGWTRKEAVLKTLGTGLLADPSRLPTGLERARRRVPVSGILPAGGTCDVETIAADARAVVSIAAVAGWSRLQLFEFPADAGRLP